MIRSSKDFWTGVIYIAFGVAAILIAREYGMGTALKMGPAYFPTVLGALLIVIGAIAVIRAFHRRWHAHRRLRLQGACADSRLQSFYSDLSFAEQAWL